MLRSISRSTTTSTSHLLRPSSVQIRTLADKHPSIAAQEAHKAAQDYGNENTNQESSPPVLSPNGSIGKHLTPESSIGQIASKLGASSVLPGQPQQKQDKQSFSTLQSSTPSSSPAQSLLSSLPPSPFSHPLSPFSQPLSPSILAQPPAGVNAMSTLAGVGAGAKKAGPPMFGLYVLDVV